MKSIRGMLSNLTRYQLTAVVVVLFALGGVIYAQVAKVHLKFEAEAGTIIGQAAKTPDNGASDGNYLAFNAVTPPPSGTQFFEGFDTDTRSRFDWRLTTTVEPPQDDFLGDHDTATPCNGPTTYRTIHQLPLQWGVKHTNVNIENTEFIWWCAPGNDSAKGHMMTALDTHSIAAMAFSPKQSFTNVRKVCYDQNMTNLGEGKWLNTFIVPASDVAAHNNDLNYLAGSGVAFGGIDQMLPAGAVDFTWLRGSISSNKVQSNGTYSMGFDQWMSIDPVDTNGDGVIDKLDAPTKGQATDPAPRFTVCIDDGNNQVTIERPDGSFDTYPYTIAFPTGSVRIIFQDASYNPTKHNGFGTHLTWHWDNITIE